MNRIDKISDVVSMFQGDNGSVVATQIVDSITNLLESPVNTQEGELHVATYVVITINRVMETP